MSAPPGHATLADYFTVAPHVGIPDADVMDRPTQRRIEDAVHRRGVFGVAELADMLRVDAAEGDPVMTSTGSTAASEARVGEACDRLLDLLRQTCGKDLNDDGTEWCARTRGHDGDCRPLPGGVRF